MNAKTLSKYKIKGATRCASCCGTGEREHYADELLQLTGAAYTGPCFRCRWDAFTIGIASHFRRFDLTDVIGYYGARRP